MSAHLLNLAEILLGFALGAALITAGAFATARRWGLW